MIEAQFALSCEFAPIAVARFMTTMPTLNRPERMEDEGRSNPELTQNAVIFRPPPLWKRTIDIVGSVGLLVLLSPLLVSLGLYIKLVSRGPIIFSQRRIGSGMREFVIYKFRTMESGDGTAAHSDYVAQLANSDQPAKKPEYQSRLICGGKFLRRLSLDELPQLVNVLIGNMSLVGPRPDLLDLEYYKTWQLRRFEVLPGISGLWQVSGKNSLTFSQMCELDIQYIDNIALREDLRIMVKTLTLILSQDNE